MTLQLYQTLFMIFVSLTIVFAILSIVLFFLFDIRKMIRMKTGADMRQRIRELEECYRSKDGGQRKRYQARSIRQFMGSGPEMSGKQRATDPGMTGQQRVTDPGMTGQQRVTDPEMTGQQRVTDPGMTGQQRVTDPGMTGQQWDTDPGMTGQQEPADFRMTGHNSAGQGEAAAGSMEEYVTESLRSDGDSNAATVLTGRTGGEQYTEQLEKLGAAPAGYYFHITETKIVAFSETVI